jgi:hypothetical protein
MTILQSPILHPLLSKIQHEFTKSPPKIVKTTPSQSDIDFISREANSYSPFDPKHRHEMYEMLSQRKAILTAFDIHDNSHYIGRVVCILPKNVRDSAIPWELWSRILRIFQEPSAKNNVNCIRIFFFAHPSKRQFPKRYVQIPPENINGGYTSRCSTNGIVIYRAEEATRVLIHELFHAKCSDNPEQHLDNLEALTETWAELIYAILLAKGDSSASVQNIERQIAYTLQQNERIRKYHSISNKTLQEKLHANAPFPWRYTILKEDIWQKWGLASDPSSRLQKNMRASEITLRLTPEPTPSQKREFNISQSSTIL